MCTEVNVSECLACLRGGKVKEDVARIVSDPKVCNFSRERLTKAGYDKCFNLRDDCALAYLKITTFRGVHTTRERSHVVELCGQPVIHIETEPHVYNERASLFIYVPRFSQRDVCIGS